MPMYTISPFYGRGPCHPGPHAGPFGGSFHGPHRGGPHSCSPHRGGSNGKTRNCGPHRRLGPQLLLLSLLQHQQEAMEQAAAATEQEERKPQTYSASQRFHRTDSDEATVLSIDVTGFSLSDLEVRVEKHVLSLNGTRKNRLGDVFELHRQLVLNKLQHNEDSITANIDDGILTITIAKKCSPVNVRIPIQTEHDDLKLPVADEVIAENLDHSKEETEHPSPDAKENTNLVSQGTTTSVPEPDADLLVDSGSLQDTVTVETVVDGEAGDDEVQSWEEVEDHKKIV